MTLSHSVPIISLPEEIIERILSLAIAGRPWSHQQLPRQSIHLQKYPNVDSPDTIIAVEPLLFVCRKFCRIVTPLVYARLVIHTRRQAFLLSRTLSARPDISRSVRRVDACGAWNEVGCVLRCLDSRAGRGSLETLDLMLDADNWSEEPVALTSALPGLTSMRHLILRKQSSTYVTYPKITHVLGALAKAIESWTLLETANIAFKLSDDSRSAVPLLAPMPMTQPIPQPPPPSSLALRRFSAPFLHDILPLSRSSTHAQPPPRSQTPPPSPPPAAYPTQSVSRALAEALARARALHTLLACVPAVWSPLLAIVAQNPRLERVVLDPVERPLDGPWAGWDKGPGVLSSSLFMMEARKWTRLSDLICAGTPTICTRAGISGTSLRAKFGTSSRQVSLLRHT